MFQHMTDTGFSLRIWKTKHRNILLGRIQKTILVNDEWMDGIYGNMKTSLTIEMNFIQTKLNFLPFDNFDNITF